MKKLYLGVVVLGGLSLVLVCVYPLLIIGSGSERVYLAVETDRVSYSSGEEIRVDVYFMNGASTEISLPSLGYGLEISGPQGTVLAKVESRASLGPVHVKPFSKALVTSFVWDQRDMSGDQVPPSTYTMHVNLLESDYSGKTTVRIE